MAADRSRTPVYCGILSTFCLIAALAILICAVSVFWQELRVIAFESSIDVPPSDSVVLRYSILLIATAVGFTCCFLIAAWFWRRSRYALALSLTLMPTLVFGLIVISPLGSDFMTAAAQAINARKSPYRITDERSPNKLNDLINGHTPIHDAARMGNVKYLAYLISQGGDVNTEGRETGGETPMCVASGRPMVDFLLEHGATLDQHNSLGHTPLMALTYRNHGEAAKHLVSLGADINTEDRVRQMNALSWACLGASRDRMLDDRARESQQRIQLIRFLCSCGADLNDRDTVGRTPLHHAILQGNEPLALVLLELNADPALADHDGKTPLDLAQELNLTVVVDALQRR